MGEYHRWPLPPSSNGDDPRRLQPPPPFPAPPSAYFAPSLAPPPSLPPPHTLVPLVVPLYTPYPPFHPHRQHELEQAYGLAPVLPFAHPAVAPGVLWSEARVAPSLERAGPLLMPSDLPRPPSRWLDRVGAPPTDAPPTPTPTPTARLAGDAPHRAVAALIKPHLRRLVGSVLGLDVDAAPVLPTAPRQDEVAGWWSSWGRGGRLAEASRLPSASSLPDPAPYDAWSLHTTHPRPPPRLHHGNRWGHHLAYNNHDDYDEGEGGEEGDDEGDDEGEDDDVRADYGQEGGKARGSGGDDEGEWRGSTARVGSARKRSLQEEPAGPGPFHPSHGLYNDHHRPRGFPLPNLTPGFPGHLAPPLPPAPPAFPPQPAGLAMPFASALPGDYLPPQPIHKRRKLCPEKPGMRQCNAYNQNGTQRCQNPCLLECWGPPTVYCAEHIDLDSNSPFGRCSAMSQRNQRRRKCKEVVLKEFGVCHKHIRGKLEELYRPDSDAPLQHAQDVLRRAMLQRDQVRELVRNTFPKGGDVYQRRSKLTPKFEQMIDNINEFIAQKMAPSVPSLASLAPSATSLARSTAQPPPPPSSES